MASITSTGLGSGLDVAGIVSQLVAAEGRPVETRLSTQEARAQTKLSAFGSLKSALSDLRDSLSGLSELDSVLLHKASSADETVFKASAGQGASPATYSVEVVDVAQAQRLMSGAFADSDTAVGTGTLDIGLGAESFSVEITAENNTLAGIRDAINGAIDNPGIAATIVNADSGSYLILSSTVTGAASTITVTQSGGDGGLASLEYDPGNGLNALTETIAAQDAHIRIDGLDVMSASNTIADAIDGVTITVVEAAPGEPATLSVVEDTAAARAQIDAFVGKYNDLVDTFDRLTSYDPETEAAGALLGDSGVRTIRDQLRRALSDAVTDIDASFSTLAEVGITVDVGGKLSVDDTKLNSALTNDYTKLGQLFAASDGYAVRLTDLVDGYLASDGQIETRTAGLNDLIAGYGDERDRLNERLAALETRLTKQFSALDSLIGELTQTSNFLTQQLAALSTNTTQRNNS
jgi:flagellar hook-associated protein 2